MRPGRAGRMKGAWLGALGLVGLMFVAFACGGDEENFDSPSKAPQNPPPAPPKPVAKADAGADAKAEPSNLPPLPVREFGERDFAETGDSRDPFRSFATMFEEQANTRVRLQRKVLIDQYALDELKLVGVVTRTAPRALFVDPTGYGWVAHVGDFVGKAEMVHTGGPSGTDIAINWRIDRIRDGDVVFVREDPSHPEIAPTTRVVALRTPEEEEALRQGRKPPR